MPQAATQGKEETAVVSLSDLLDRLERVPQHSEYRNRMYQAINDIAVHGAHRGSHLPRRRYLWAMVGGTMGDLGGFPLKVG